MSETQETGPARPALSLRIGVTGLRRLRHDQIARIEKDMGDVLDLVRLEIDDLAHNSRVCPFYDHKPNATPLPFLTMVSPLARGADRVAAYAAKQRGWKLFVPMPFSEAEYATDFTGTGSGHPEEVQLTAQQDRDQFDELLRYASGVIELDGGRKLYPTDTENSLEGFSYEFAGHFVVRQCDLLIAIWDGRASRGRGGTADIVRYAASVGVPVWWINSDKPQEAYWLAARHNWREIDPDAARAVKAVSGDARAKLKAYLKRLILMPDPPRNRPEDEARPTETVERVGHVPFNPKLASAEIYLNEKPNPATGLWTIYSEMMSMFRPAGKATPWVEEEPPTDLVPRLWYESYRPANDRANEYAARYRSSYVIVIVCATIALTIGSIALGLGIAHERLALCIPEGFTIALTAVELCLLTMVIFYVALAKRLCWHVRSIEYRLLAELFRKQQMLAALGWALSIGNVRHMTDADRQSWVSWFFAATQRAAPMPSGDLTSLQRREVNKKALIAFIEEQIGYHHSREKISHKAAETFERIGYVVFVAVILFVLAKLIFEVMGEPPFSALVVLGLLATLLPGVSAAFVGVRSYAEWQLLTEQSNHMIVELTDAKARVEAIDLQRTLASQDLGTEALAVATIMLQDLDGWGRLFRGKVNEFA